MSFQSLGLSDALLRAVAEVGYTEPTPIQLQAIPAVLAGGDLLAGAQTGTGKTAGFVLPLLQRLSTSQPVAGRKPIRVLILTPTRELAAQVEESVRVYGKYVKLSSTVIFGGVGINPQIEALRRGVDILVATPGRLLDHCGQRTVDLSKVETLVLDEADRMLDMGFIHDIRRVLALLPRQRQNLLFSATFSDEIRELANGLLHSPVHIQVTPRNTTVDSVAQKVHPVDARRKAELLVHLVREHQWFQVLVFTRTKHGANKLATQLEKSGIAALAIHGNKSQNARTRALADFKSNRIQVLVATDIAARGLDIEQLPHVVNFDLPNVPEDYVHRIGRTGRAGATGEAISLVSADERILLRDIERLIKRAIPRVEIPGFEPGTAPATAEHDTVREPREARGPRGQRAPSRPAGASSAARTRPPAARRDGERGRGPADATRGDAPRQSARPAAPPQSGAAPADRGPAAKRPSSSPGHRNATPATARTGAGNRTGAGGSARRGGAEANANAMVRSNLPPGWTLSSPGRRGR
ncbi:MAG TPA: DEAD/DEAH box helicase [Burkholderiaceae bacterium]|nr:DEAD/DEAH box helicase [Burkholderiaceae bacterium]